MTHYTRCFMALMFLVLANCSPIKNSSSETKALLVGAGVWDKTNLTLCFRDEYNSYADYDMLRDRFENLLKEQYTPETTGVYFEGFKDCKDTLVPAFHVVLSPVGGITGDNGVLFGQVNSIGKDLSFLNEPTAISGFLQIRNGNNVFMPTGVVIFMDAFHKAYGNDNNTKIASFDYTVLHEIAHLLGMHHEHAHKDSTCEYQQLQSYHTESFEGRMKYDHRGTKYDPLSITNYCLRDFAFEGQKLDPQLSETITRIELSKCDKSTLKHAYTGSSIASECLEVNDTIPYIDTDFFVGTSEFDPFDIFNDWTNR